MAALPELTVPPSSGHEPANAVVPGYFADYETRGGLRVLRPVRVQTVTDVEGHLLQVRSADASWLTKTVINATGTWQRPFLPYYPGAESFAGRQLHTHDYTGPAQFAGQQVIVVGGGASAVQILAELSEVSTTTWVTRRPPVWRSTPFTSDEGRRAVARVEDRVRRGLPPQSVVSVTGLALREQEQAALERGVYERLPMFDHIVPSGVV